MAEQTPRASESHPRKPPAVTVEWPGEAEMYIAASPIVDVAQDLLGACKELVAALARQVGAATFGVEDARALEAGRAAIAKVGRAAAGPGD